MDSMKPKCVLLYPEEYKFESIVKPTLAELIKRLGYDLWDWDAPGRTAKPVISKIQEELSSADRVIAILHSPDGMQNPNVMYEVGFVEGHQGIGFSEC